MVSTISRYMPMRGKVRCCIVRPPMRVSLRRAIHPWNQAYHELFRANPKINFSTVVDCSYRYAGSEIPYGIARGTDDRDCSAWLGLSTLYCAVLTHSGGCTSEKKSYRYFCVQFAGTNQNVSMVPHLSADPCSVGVQPVWTELAERKLDRWSTLFPKSHPWDTNVQFGYSSPCQTCQVALLFISSEECRPSLCASHTLLLSTYSIHPQRL